MLTYSVSVFFRWSRGAVGGAHFGQVDVTWPTQAVRFILIAWGFVTRAGQHTLRARPLGKVVGLRAVRLSKMGHHRGEQRIDAKKLELGVSSIRVHIGLRALCFGYVRLLEQGFQGY